MKNATEVVTELYRKFPKVEFIDERDLGEDIVGLMFEYRNTETDEEQLKAYLDSIGNWYRIRESREFYGGKSLLVKAEDDYVSLPVEDDFGYSHYEDKPEPDYLLGEAVEGERAFMLRKGVLPDGTDSMLFIVSPSNRLCIVNGKEGMNDPTNTEPLYMQGEKATIGGWEEELDKDTIVSLYLHQDGIVLDDADEEIDTEEDPEEGRFKRIASKSVQDSDGFYTDYTWYFDNEDRKHVFVFGDTDVYYPEDGYYDWEVEGDDERAQAEAQEWFDSYTGFEEHDYNESLKESENHEPDFVYYRLKDRVSKLYKDLAEAQKNEKDLLLKYSVDIDENGFVTGEVECDRWHNSALSEDDIRNILEPIFEKNGFEVESADKSGEKSIYRIVDSKKLDLTDRSQAMSYAMTLESLKEDYFYPGWHDWSFGRPDPWNDEPDEPYVIVCNDGEIQCYSVEEAIDTANKENVDIIELRPDPYSSKVIKRYSRNANGTFETLLKEVAISLAKSGLTGADIADNLMANYKADKNTACELGKDAYNYVRYELGYFDESLEENVSDSESDWAMGNELKKTKLKTIDDDSPVYKSKAGKYFSLGSDDKYSGTFPEYCYDSEDPASCEKQFKSGMWTNKRKFDKASGKYVKEDYCDMFGCESGFFTRDDLNELMYEINDRCPKGMQATAIYMGDDEKTLEVDMEDDEYGSETVYKKIDMRKIRKPSDLLRYANSIIADFQNTVGKWEVGNEE